MSTLLYCLAILYFIITYVIINVWSAKLLIVWARLCGEHDYIMFFSLFEPEDIDDIMLSIMAVLGLLMLVMTIVVIICAILLIAFIPILRFLGKIIKNSLF